MNILFLVTSFLLIFSFISASLLKNSLFFSHEKSSYCSYLSSKQKLQSKWERYQYAAFKKARTKEAKEPAKPPSIRTPNSFSSHRERKNLSRLAKWNLAPMLLADVPSDLLEEKAALLLEELYAHTAFWKKAQENVPDLSVALITCFKAKNLKKEDLKTLSDLFPNESLLREPFYKMLKGSSFYNIEKKEGYPPLEEFFKIDVEDAKTLTFPYASYPAIKVFFGEEIAEKIVLLEKDKSQKQAGCCSLSQEELLNLATQKGLFTLYKDPCRSFKAGSV